MHSNLLSQDYTRGESDEEPTPVKTPRQKVSDQLKQLPPSSHLQSVDEPEVSSSDSDGESCLSVDMTLDDESDQEMIGNQSEAPNEDSQSSDSDVDILHHLYQENSDDQGDLDNSSDIGNDSGDLVSQSKPQSSIEQDNSDQGSERSDNDGPYVTRSNRSVKFPSYLKDYECDH